MPGSMAPATCRNPWNRAARHRCAKNETAEEAEPCPGKGPSECRGGRVSPAHSVVWFHSEGWWTVPIDVPGRAPEYHVGRAPGRALRRRPRRRPPRHHSAASSSPIFVASLIGPHFKKLFLGTMRRDRVMEDIESFIVISRGARGFVHGPRRVYLVVHHRLLDMHESVMA